jgi:hypothetical protein
VDRSDDGDRRVLHRELGVGQARPLGCLSELADIGAGDERATGTDQHDRGRTVLDRLCHAVGETLADVPAECIHGRVVEAAALG